jgi:dTMP kinase
MGERSGLFLVLEGAGGSGKSTATRTLAKALSDHGFTVVATKEPGHTKMGQKMREIVLDPELSEYIDAGAQVDLFCLARRAFVTEIVWPALARGEIVISDRYELSTFVYQGFGSGVDLKFIDARNQRATSGLKPERTYWLDVTVEEGLRRIYGDARTERDRYDEAELDFHHRLREGYRQMWEDSGGAIQRIETMNKKPDEVAAAILADALNLIEQKWSSYAAVP